MKKLARKINNRMFDVAVAPAMLATTGVPVIIIVVIAAALVFVVITLIRNARKKNIEAKSKHDGNDSYGNDE